MESTNPILFKDLKLSDASYLRLNIEDIVASYTDEELINLCLPASLDRLKDDILVESGRSDSELDALYTNNLHLISVGLKHIQKFNIIVKECSQSGFVEMLRDSEMESYNRTKKKFSNLVVPVTARKYCGFKVRANNGTY